MALRARADGELERLRTEVERAHTDARLARAELAALRERGTDELRALVAAAVQGKDL
jgi:colicin import membrane protein